MEIKNYFGELDYVFESGEGVAFFDYEQHKNEPQFRNSLKNLQFARVDKMVKLLPTLRKTLQSPFDLFLYSTFLNEINNSFFEVDESQKEFLRLLNEVDLNDLAKYEVLKKQAEAMYLDKINSSFDLNTKIAFEVCNKLSVQLDRYSFSVSGLVYGRSTKRPLLNYVSGYDSTPFTSDIIIAPNKCMRVEWTAAYMLFDQYDVSDIRGVWEN